MTEDQGTELIIILKQIAESLAEIAGNTNLLAMEDLSMRDKAALAALNGLLADGDYSSTDGIASAAREIGDAFMRESDG
jgi:hypothetical protein